MRIPISLIIILLAGSCLSQNPTITFGGLKEGTVSKKELLKNEGIIFSNDSTKNIQCLIPVDFSFRIAKLNGDTLSIQTNNYSERGFLMNEKRMMKNIEKGKIRNYYKHSRCQGVNRFNADQIKAIKKMMPGESLLIEQVLTRPSNCSCIGRWWKAGLIYTIK